MTMTTRPRIASADMAERRRTMELRRRQAIAELAAQRRATGLSQTDIAARMGTSQSAIARLEAGDGDVRATTLERYAAAIGCEISWFVRGPGAVPLT